MLLDPVEHRPGGMEWGICFCAVDKETPCKLWRIGQNTWWNCSVKNHCSQHINAIGSWLIIPIHFSLDCFCVLVLKSSWWNPPNWFLSHFNWSSTTHLWTGIRWSAYFDGIFQQEVYILCIFSWIPSSISTFKPLSIHYSIFHPYAIFLVKYSTNQKNRTTKNRFLNSSKSPIVRPGWSFCNFLSVESSPLLYTRSGGSWWQLLADMGKRYEK